MEIAGKIGNAARRLVASKHLLQDEWEWCSYMAGYIWICSTAYRVDKV